jgi:hypothetical protein
VNAEQLIVHLSCKNFAFALRFDNEYHKKLLKDYLQKFGYKSVDADPEDVVTLASRSQLFQKNIYWSPYDADAWRVLSKKQPASPVILVASDKRVKSADDWVGPSEPQILGELQQDLSKRGHALNADAWKLLVDSYRNQEGKIDDPQAIWHMAYSLALQTEGNVDLATVRTNVGFKARIYDMFDTLVTKNKRGALQAMFILVNEQEAVQMCMGLQKMLADLMDCQAAIRQGKTVDTYAAESKLHPYRAQKMFQQANRVPARFAMQLAESLMTMELELKKTSALSLTERFKNRLMHYLDQP